MYQEDACTATNQLKPMSSILLLLSSLAIEMHGSQHTYQPKDTIFE